MSIMYKNFFLTCYWNEIHDIHRAHLLLLAFFNLIQFLGENFTKENFQSIRYANELFFLPLLTSDFMGFYINEAYMPSYTACKWFFFCLH